MYPKFFNFACCPVFRVAVIHTRAKKSTELSTKNAMPLERFNSLPGTENGVFNFEIEASLECHSLTCQSLLMMNVGYYCDDDDDLVIHSILPWPIPVSPSSITISQIPLLLTIQSTNLPRNYVIQIIVSYCYH